MTLEMLDDLINFYNQSPYCDVTRFSWDMISDKSDFLDEYDNVIASTIASPSVRIFGIPGNRDHLSLLLPFLDSMCTIVFGRDLCYLTFNDRESLSLFELTFAEFKLQGPPAEMVLYRALAEEIRREIDRDIFESIKQNATI